MSAIPIIRQTDDLPFVFDLGGESIKGWVCEIFVKVYPDDDAIISRVIPANSSNDAWEGFLTSTETAALAVSSKSPYYLIGKLTNAESNEQRQIPRRFHVGQDLRLPVREFLLLEDDFSKLLLEDGASAILLEA